MSTFIQAHIIFNTFFGCLPADKHSKTDSQQEPACGHSSVLRSVMTIST